MDMIKINLLEQKKPFKLPTVLGADLSKVNLKAIIVAIVVSYMPSLIIYDDWVNAEKELDEKISKLREEGRALNKEVRANKDVEKKLTAFNKQVEDLKERSRRVEQIIQQKTNPKDALERLSRDIEDDMWFTKLVLTKENDILIDGISYSFKSISNFLLKANESRFFGKTLEVVESKTLIETYRGKKRRVESFKIKGKIIYANLGKRI